MKFHHFRLQLIFVLFLISNFISGQKYSHEQQVIYFGRVATQMRDMKDGDEMAAMISRLSKDIKVGKKFKREKKDSLNNYFSQIMADIDQRISSLKNIKDGGDEPFKIKENVLVYWIEMQKSMKILFPLILKMYQYGEKSLSKEELNNVKATLEKIQNIEDDKMKIKKLLQRFKRENEISENETANYDL